MKQTISAIIVNFRADDHVRRLKKELAAQTRQPDEIIVIDNSDGNSGFGAGCNQGAKQATGEYLFFLNPDVSLASNYIDALHASLQIKDCSLAGSQVRRPDNTIETTASCIPGPLLALVEFSFLKKLPRLGTWAEKQYRLDGFDHDASRFVPCLAGCAWMVHTDDFWKAGGFDENLFLYFEEFDFCGRLAKMGKKVFFCAETSLIHYGQASTSQVASTSRKHFLHSRRYWMRKAYGFWGSIIAAFLTWTEK